MFALLVVEQSHIPAQFFVSLSMPSMGVDGRVTPQLPPAWKFHHLRHTGVDTHVRHEVHEEAHRE